MKHADCISTLVRLEKETEESEEVTVPSQVSIVPMPRYLLRELYRSIPSDTNMTTLSRAYKLTGGFLISMLENNLQVAEDCLS